MDPVSKRYASKSDAVDQDILPALGEHGHAYDVDGIFAEAFTYRVDTDSQGRELLNSAGFEQTVDVDEFWKIAERHERPDTPAK